VLPCPYSMANQEVGHATLLSNILQGMGAKQCQYRYDFADVPSFIQVRLHHDASRVY